MKYPTKKLAVLLAILLAGCGLIYVLGQHRTLPYYEEMKDAAERMTRAEAAIREERLSRGIPISEGDILGFGLLGREVSSITTTLGALEAKRTAQLPDMAALCVRLYHEAGLKRGDTLAACFSGSFPGLNLAAVCGADAMGLNLIYTVSIGTSSYGGNIPEFTSPEMLMTAYRKGCIRSAPVEVSMGGEADAGLNMIGIVLEETEEIDAMLERMKAEGMEVLRITDYSENIAYHMALYGTPDGFINVGGSAVGAGGGESTPQLGQGLLKKKYPVDSHSGLAVRYLAQDVPTMHLLNVKQLCAEYGLDYDPAVQPEIGTSGVYFANEYSRPAIGVLLAGALGSLVYLRLRKKKETVN